jgi:hypothetical protein
VLVLVVTFLIGDGFVGDHVQSKNESVASKTNKAARAKKVGAADKYEVAGRSCC